MMILFAVLGTCLLQAHADCSLDGGLKNSTSCDAPAEDENSLVQSWKHADRMPHESAPPRASTERLKVNLMWWAPAMLWLALLAPIVVMKFWTGAKPRATEALLRGKARLLFLLPGKLLPAISSCPGQLWDRLGGAGKQHFRTGHDVGVSKNQGPYVRPKTVGLSL